VVFINNAYPINILNAIRNVSEVCNVFCATSNPVEVVVFESDQGRRILGVIDGFKPKGVEDSKKIDERKSFLRRIGYKR